MILSISSSSSRSLFFFVVDLSSFLVVWSYSGRLPSFIEYRLYDRVIWFTHKNVREKCSGVTRSHDLHYVGCVFASACVHRKLIPLYSAFITPSLQPTSQRIHTAILLQYHIHFYTIIQQTSNIVSQWMYCSWSWEIGFTNSWHHTASTRRGRVHFHHVQSVYLKDLPSVTPHLGLWSSYAWQFSFFSINSPLSSAFTTPSLQPASQRHLLSHFATILHLLLHNRPPNFLHFPSVHVSFRGWVIGFTSNN